MKKLTDLNGKEFQTFMESFKIEFPKAHNQIMNMYFSEFDSIEESWNNDFDEVWDAEGTLEDFAKQNSKANKFITEYLSNL